MRSCPFCFGEIHTEARKCKHCGEWVKGGPQVPSSRSGGSSSDDGLGRAANRFVSLQVVLAIVGIVVAVVMFFAFFLPHWQGTKDRLDQKWGDGPPRHVVPEFPPESR